MGTKILLIIGAIVFSYVTEISGDKGCAEIPISQKSLVCACDDRYCDTITRVPPTDDTYVVYISSESGLRFNKTVMNLRPAKCNMQGECNEETLILDPETEYQSIEGFGGAVTDAAAINWKSMPEGLQQHLIESYFSAEGLEYNMLRVPIGGTDFSTHGYAYNDFPEDDAELAHFNLTEEDYEYKIPMIKAAMNAATEQIHIVSSTWSPPPWMKTNNKYTGWSKLKKEYYQTYADYHVKFLEKYLEQDIPVWAITTTNEPTNGLLGMCFGINCVGWSAYDMGYWIEYHLGPTIRQSAFRDTEILAGDDQRLTIPYWMNVMAMLHPGALQYIDGIAVHFYTDFLAPPQLLSELSKFYPDKYIISTEACLGSAWFEKNHVDLGSWDRAKEYILDIITDINHGVVGWIDWNLVLDHEGGPTWAGNYVDSPIIVLPGHNIFVKQPMFYAMGHFSKFVPRGSSRIESLEAGANGGGFGNKMSHVSFVTPRDTVVVVIYNDGGDRTINIKLGDKEAVVDMPEDSVTTVELPY